jgi:hypothetical protein
LTGILENVDDTFLMILQINGLPVRDQVKVGVALQNLGQAAAHFALQEPEHAADLLE